MHEHRQHPGRSRLLAHRRAADDAGVVRMRAQRVAASDRSWHPTPAWRLAPVEVEYHVGYATLGRIGFEGRHHYAVIGNVVILASRLSSQAAADQILLSHRAAGITESLVEVESVGELQIKGLSRPLSASNVLIVT